MASVTIKRWENVGGRRDRKGWCEISCAAVVSGLVATTYDALLIEAKTALAAANFYYGAAHPSIPGLYLFGEMDFSLRNSTTADVVLNYERKSHKNDETYIDIRGDVVTVAEQTNLDREGNNIEVSYTAPGATSAKIQTGFVEKMVQSQSLEFAMSGDSSPATLARSIVGRVNSDQFQGDAAGHWLCMGCPFRSPDSGETWEWSWRFVYSETQWKQTVYYIGENGRPPADYNNAANAGNTVKLVEVYGQVPFSVLALPNAFA